MMKYIIFFLLFCSVFAECRYVAPKEPLVHESFFHSLIKRSDERRTESFSSIAQSIEREAPFCHTFKFRYPVKDPVTFAKVMVIKTQEAHRFVPVIASSKFIERRNLGFSREIVIADGGPTVLEHVLVDKESPRVIFIEEAELLPNGEKKVGSFAAINRVVEEEGGWFFTGSYLYNWEPSPEEISELCQLFQDTYDNMIIFMEKENVERAYEELQKF